MTTPPINNDPSERALTPAETVCPACGGELVPIAYGMPGAEMWEAAQRGEIRLGGCCISPGMPTQECRSCGKQQSRSSFDWPFDDDEEETTWQQ